MYSAARALRAVYALAFSLALTLDRAPLVLFFASACLSKFSLLALGNLVFCAIVTERIWRSSSYSASFRNLEDVVGNFLRPGIRLEEIPAVELVPPAVIEQLSYPRPIEKIGPGKPGVRLFFVDPAPPWFTDLRSYVNHFGTSLIFIPRKLYTPLNPVDKFKLYHEFGHISWSGTSQWGWEWSLLWQHMLTFFIVVLLMSEEPYWVVAATAYGYLRAGALRGAYLSGRIDAQIRIQGFTTRIERELYADSFALRAFEDAAERQVAVELMIDNWSLNIESDDSSPGTRREYRERISNLQDSFEYEGVPAWIRRPPALRGLLYMTTAVFIIAAGLHLSEAAGASYLPMGILAIGLTVWSFRAVRALNRTEVALPVIERLIAERLTDPGDATLPARIDLSQDPWEGLTWHDSFLFAGTFFGIFAVLYHSIDPDYTWGLIGIVLGVLFGYPAVVWVFLKSLRATGAAAVMVGALTGIITAVMTIVHFIT